MRSIVAKPTVLTPQLVVTGVWVAMSAAAIGFVCAFGTNFPVADEWATLHILSANKPDRSWLWERHNEHLFTLPRLVYWAAFRLSGDLRCGMLLSVIGWSLLAKLLTDVARIVRGRTTYADVFFPIILLNWSHYENLLMSYQVAFMVASVLAGLMLRELVIGTVTFDRLLRVGLYTVLLPLSGGSGLILAVPGMAWLMVAGIASRYIWLGVSLVFIAFVSASSYFWAFPSADPAWQPPLTAKSVIVGVLGFSSVGYGLAGWHLWPWLAVVPTAVAGVTGWSVGRAWLSVQPQHRLGLFGLTVFAVTAMALAVLIAWGRARYGTFAVFFSRYSVLSALLPITMFFLWLRYGGHQLARFGPVFLASTTILLLPLNMTLGFAAGKRQFDVQRAVEKDLRAGMPIEIVAERTNFLVFNDSAAWAKAAEFYANANLGQLKKVSHLPPVETIRIDPTAVTAEPNGWYTISLDQPRRVHAVRIIVRFQNQNPHRPARFLSAWRCGTTSVDYKRHDWLFRLPSHEFGYPRQVVWTDGLLTRFQFLPDADAPDESQIIAVEFLSITGCFGEISSLR